MKVVLVGIKNNENLKLLNNFFANQFEIHSIHNGLDLSDYFDLLIIDRFYLNKFRREIIEIKEKKRFIPILFLSSESNYRNYDSFSKYIDDILDLPVSKWELKFRISKLLNLSITKESELKYKKILESSNIGICVIENDIITSHNDNFLNILNLRNKIVLKEEFINIFTFDNDFLNDKINYFKKLSIESIQFDQTIKIDGVERYLNIKLSSLIKNEGKKSIFMVLLDITNNINTIKEIEFLNKHDRLTGLFNRAFLDRYMGKIEENTDLPMSIIMGDIDGLKLINDGFGHKKGDETIIDVAKTLEKSCRRNDKIFRIGGDEFLIILPNTPTEAAMNVVNRIHSAISFNESLDYSISLGMTTKNHSYENFQDLVVKAENIMYQNKLVNNESHRHSVIESLEKVLIENTNETHDHAERMKDMVKKMTKKLDSDISLEQELNLLARLHDIGKVSIPESILKKPTKLTDEEWEIVKEHPAAGYRITKTIPNLASVSYDILCHHERWDGNGYPQGLKGEEIPIASRIISIIDSYDVMMHERSYKEAFSKKESIMELKRCSGTQFDPKLVKVFLEIISENYNEVEPPLKERESYKGI